MATTHRTSQHQQTSSSRASDRGDSHPRERAWYHHITLDVLLKSLNRSILHPFIAWIFVLCLRAQVVPYEHPAFIGAVGWAVFRTLLAVAGVINDRIAFGEARTVDLSEEVVVVTGGASGLGLLIAQIYGLRGASVAVVDVKEVSEIAEVWGEKISGVEYYRCDVGNRKEVEATRSMIEKDLGTPTVLINCAAAEINGQPLLTLPAEAFQQTIRTNLTAAFHTCQVFLPGILSAPHGGTIVTVSSVLGQLCAANLSDYSASKAGLSALHRTLEAELRATGYNDKVKTLLVETGQMATPLFERIKTPSNFFAPMLEPVQVAQNIVAAIEGGRSGIIRLPAFATLVNWYAILPAGVQRIARYMSGIDEAVAKAGLEKRPIQKNAPAPEVSESDIDLVETD